MHLHFYSILRSIATSDWAVELIDMGYWLITTARIQKKVAHWPVLCVVRVAMCFHHCRSHVTYAIYPPLFSVTPSLIHNITTSLWRRVKNLSFCVFHQQFPCPLYLSRPPNFNPISKDNWSRSGNFPPTCFNRLKWLKKTTVLVQIIICTIRKTI